MGFKQKNKIRDLKQKDEVRKQICKETYKGVAE